MLNANQSLFTNRMPEYTQYDIGDFTYGKPAIADWHVSKLSIGKFTSISPRVQILLGGHHDVNAISTYPFNVLVLGESPQTQGDVHIGNDVWIGQRVTILSGVSIGDGAVIAAGAVVADNVEPYALVGGVPARLIRYRFNEETRRKLLKLQWWNWSLERIEKNLLYLNDPNKIEEFIKKNEE
jgi:acetyltransferase-like isoleucine patch superfamily enzyme